MSYNLDWQVIIDALPLFINGIKITIFVSLISGIVALLIGITGALGRLSNIKPLKFIASCYVEFFRNTPLLVQIYIIYRGFPNIGIELSPILCGIIALSLYTGSYVTEVVRSGIQSIAIEQTEAAKALGFSSFQRMCLIILPQALRIIIPPLGNLFINLTKNSSLLSFITVQELFYVLYYGSVSDFRYLEFFIVGCLIYMLIVSVIAMCANTIEHYLKIPGRS